MTEGVMMQPLLSPKLKNSSFLGRFITSTPMKVKEEEDNLKQNEMKKNEEIKYNKKLQVRFFSGGNVNKNRKFIHSSVDKKSLHGPNGNSQISLNENLNKKASYNNMIEFNDKKFNNEASQIKRNFANLNFSPLRGIKFNNVTNKDKNKSIKINRQIKNLSIVAKGNAVVGNVKLQVNSQVNSNVNSPINSVVNSPINSAVNSPITSHLNPSIIPTILSLRIVSPTADKKSKSKIKSNTKSFSTNKIPPKNEVQPVKRNSDKASLNRASIANLNKVATNKLSQNFSTTPNKTKSLNIIKNIKDKKNIVNGDIINQMNQMDGNLKNNFINYNNFQTEKRIKITDNRRSHLSLNSHPIKNNIHTKLSPKKIIKMEIHNHNHSNKNNFYIENSTLNLYESPFSKLSSPSDTKAEIYQILSNLNNSSLFTQNKIQNSILQKSKEDLAKQREIREDKNISFTYKSTEEIKKDILFTNINDNSSNLGFINNKYKYLLEKFFP